MQSRIYCRNPSWNEMWRVPGSIPPTSRPGAPAPAWGFASALIYASSAFLFRLGLFFTAQEVLEEKMSYKYTWRRYIYIMHVRDYFRDPATFRYLPFLPPPSFLSQRLWIDFISVLFCGIINNSLLVQVYNQKEKYPELCWTVNITGTNSSQVPLFLWTCFLFAKFNLMKYVCKYA